MGLVVILIAENFMKKRVVMYIYPRTELLYYEEKGLIGDFS